MTLHHIVLNIALEDFESEKMRLESLGSKVNTTVHEWFFVFARRTSPTQRGICWSLSVTMQGRFHKKSPALSDQSGRKFDYPKKNVLLLKNAARLKRRAHGMSHTRSIQPSSGIHNLFGSRGHRCIMWKTELGLENNGVRPDVTQCIANVPQSARPDLPIVMNTAIQIFGIVQIRIHASQAVRCC